MELHGAASADDLARREVQHGQLAQRLLDLAREGRLVVDALGPPAAVLVGGLHDVVDHDARYGDVLGVQAARLRQVLDLHDDDAAGVLGGRGDGQPLVHDALVLEGDVALLVGGGAAQDGDVEREASVEQVLLAVELDELAGVLGGLGVHAPALDARVDEGVQADLGDQAGATRRDLAPQVDNDALGQAVAFDLAGLNLLVERERRADVRRRPVGDKARAGLTQHGDAARLPVAHGAALLQGEVARVPRLAVAVADRAADLLRPARKPHPRDADDGPVGDELCRLLRRNELCYRSFPPGRFFLFGKCL